MTIEFTCQQCDNSLRVGVENAGKTSRCPRCGTPNVVPYPATADKDIPVAPVESVPVVPENQPTEPVKRFFVDTDFGQTYGPVTQTQLDHWVTEGRVTAQYMIREEGSQGGFYASQMYPALAERPDPQPPAGAHLGKYKRSGEHAKAVVQPTRVDLGDVLRHAWRVFQNNMGLLLGTTITLTILSGISNAIDRAIERPLDGAMYLALLIAWLIVNASSLYLSIGMAQICLNLARGLPASYADLFGAGRKFFPVLLLSMIFGILGFIVVFMLTLFAVFSNVVVMFIVFFVGSGLLWLLFWPTFYLVVDGQSTVAESFGTALEVATPNILNSFVLFLATIGIMIVGLLALCVGVLFAAAFSWLLWTTAYLMMSGQLQPQKYD